MPADRLTGVVVPAAAVPAGRLVGFAVPAGRPAGPAGSAGLAVPAAVVLDRRVIDLTQPATAVRTPGGRRRRVAAGLMVGAVAAFLAGGVGYVGLRPLVEPAPRPAAPRPAVTPAVGFPVTPAEPPAPAADPVRRAARL